MRKVLITGGAGFVGSHLAHRLKADGRRVCLVDNLSTGRRDNVAELLDDHCELIVADAHDAVADPAVMRDVEQVYHLAAAVGVKLVTDQPIEMVKNNIDETAAVLAAARDAGASILIASSSEVYGKCPVLPLREDMDLVFGPTTASRWSYGLTKALDEHLAMEERRLHGLRTVIVRLFNTIGPRQIGHYGMVVPRFVESAVAGSPIEVYGDGTQTRAFCDVRDVTRAMVQLMDLPQHDHHVYNVGSAEQITIGDLAQRVRTLADSSSGVVQVPYEQAYGPDFEDPPHRLPDLSRVESAIGFRRKFSLDDTLRELIELARGGKQITTAAKGAAS